MNGQHPHDGLYAGKPLLIATSVARTFSSGGREVPVLRGVDLHIMPGSLIALYGPSGSGKTTLLNLLGGLDQPTAGRITVDGDDLTRMSEGGRARLRRRKLGFIFQNYTLMPTYTALENIDLALRLAGFSLFERQRRARATLAAMGLSAWADHLPDELSGGQRQRVAIARALSPGPRLILADEPTSGLDTRTSRRVLSLFQRVARQQGTSFIVVSHDPMVVTFVDQAYDLHDGRARARFTTRNAEDHATQPADNRQDDLIAEYADFADAGGGRRDADAGGEY